MSLAPCRDCGKPISTQAETCPACGARFPTASGKRILKGVLLSVVVLLVLAAGLITVAVLSGK
jgi:hypothetical protein